MRAKRTCWVFMLLVLLDVLLVIRSAAQTTDQRKDFSDLKSQQKVETQSLPIIGPALEGPVDPDKYYVGPSDIFSVNIWTTSPLGLMLTVTPEGSLVIPTVGEIRVADMTLSDAKKKVLAEVRKKYTAGEPTLTLLVPRQIVVTVVGNVKFPGSYVLRSIDRVDKAIQAANEPPKNYDLLKQSELADETPVKERDASKRNIRLHRRDGTVMRVDLLKFYATKDEGANPYLREGDEILVPKLGQNRSTIGVYGGVNSSGRFELVDGDRLTDAIQLAHGLSPRAMVDSIVLTRFDETGHVLIDQTISFPDFSSKPDRNILLQAGDRVFVKERPEVRWDYRVSIEGEVLYPGEYPITKDRTHLSEVLRRAGGVTEYAALSSAEIVRRSLPVDDIVFERMVTLRGAAWTSDTAYVRLENELRLRRQLVGLNLERLLKDRDSTQDVILHTEDRIIIPSVQHTVLVLGQVVSPGNVPYVQGKKVDYYVDRAGGFAENARSGDIAVIKRNTRQWLAPGETQVEDGDYIWVPRTVKQDLSYYLTLISQAASVVSVALTVYILVRTYK